MNKDVKIEVPINQKLTISLQEAAAYSGIAVSTIQQLAKRDDCDFVLVPSSRGKKMVIKREAFEKYIFSHGIG